MILTHYDEPQAECRCCGEAESAYLPQCKECGYCPQCCECGTFTSGMVYDEGAINDQLDYESRSGS